MGKQKVYFDIENNLEKYIKRYLEKEIRLWILVQRLTNLEKKMD